MRVAGGQGCSGSWNRLRSAKWEGLERARQGDCKKEFGFYSKRNEEVFKKGTNMDQFRMLQHCGGRSIEQVRSGGGKTRQEAGAADQGCSVSRSAFSSVAGLHPPDSSSSPPLTFQVVTAKCADFPSARGCGITPLRAPGVTRRAVVKTWRGVMWQRQRAVRRCGNTLR